jgi:hypothetical protein
MADLTEFKMKTVRKVAWLNCIAICCLTSMLDACFAQKKSIEIFRGNKGTKNGQPIGDRIQTGPVGVAPGSAKPGPAKRGAARTVAPTRPRRDPAVERQRAKLAATVQVIGRSLADKSFDSYRRGLMPLHDHLEQLNLATQSSYSLLDKPAAQIEVAVRHRQNLNRIVDTLIKAKQTVGLPAAPGFTADLLLARAMLAQADVEIATLENDQIAAEEASSRAIENAQRHLQIRRVDVDLGFASLSMLTNAIMLTPDGFTDGQQVLSDAVRVRRKWARENSEGGLGRIDYLAESELELARFNYYGALDSKDKASADEQLAVAKKAADRMYQAKMRFKKTGTASTYDVARAWNLRREIHSMGEPIAEETRQDQADFERIVDIANSTSDLRGRNAADISYVALLKVVNQY